MSTVRILTDSMSQIPSALRQELGIHVIPLPFVWHGRSMLDDEVSPREFYSELRTAKVLPTTSGPTPGAFKKQFEALGVGRASVLAILVGEQFSSTFSAATLAKDMTGDASVTIINSGTNTVALGFQVLAAARASKEGKDLKEILKIVARVRASCGVVFATPDIDYLRRGGRIGHIQSFLARALNLVPILEIRGGPIRVAERVRHWRNVVPRLMDLAAQRVGDKRPLRIAVVHADAENAAWSLEREVRQRFTPDELFVSELTPVLGLHAGPDALGIAYATGA